MKFEVPEEYRHCCGIYSVTNTVNNKRIIGQATDFEERFGHYVRLLGRNKYGNKHLQGSYNKHGTDNFKMELLNLCDKENLTEIEAYFCKAFNTMDSRFGYNKKDPAEHGKYSEESRKRMSRAHIGKEGSFKGHKHTEESKRKMSISLKGLVKHTEEFKAAMSKRLTGVPLSEERKKRMSERMKGTTRSEETRKKMSASLKGRKVWNKGIPLSSETKQKMSLALTGRKHSEETRKKMSETHLRMGFKHTEESKLKMSMALTGKKRSKETKQKMSELMKLEWQKRKALVKEI